uniref:cytochrome-c oxidase n=1 Tax=Dicrocoelium dendriticum TaxID=57078 RepID=A0A096XCC3_DICDE|nr:cytochrome c oxidase subunit 2 [Dicrocoelium dendriticum]AHG06505.1 cytochrome c oxidase subunit 2 [Dicrocoelium dendriticum]
MLVVPLCVGAVLLYGYLYLDLVRYMLFLCSFVAIWVFVALGWQLCDSSTLLSLENENDSVELAWTVIPTFMVIGLCYFNLRCLGPDVFTPIEKVVKIVGHQWYWGYEVFSAPGFYDSLMGDFISSVDKPLRLDVNEKYNFVVTSSDVIHSFVLPAFNMKVDAVPGRINQLSFFSNRVGAFVGYCSELCGAGHAYMPIVVEIVTQSKN